MKRAHLTHGIVALAGVILGMVLALLLLAFVGVKPAFAAQPAPIVQAATSDVAVEVQAVEDVCLASTCVQAEPTVAPESSSEAIPVPEVVKPDVIYSVKIPAPNFAEPTVQAAASAPGVEQWRSLVAGIFPTENVQRELNVMRCESNGDPNATGGAGERGLMQIHPIHADSTYDPRGNIQASARISDYGRTYEAWDGPTPGRGEARANGGGC